MINPISRTSFWFLFLMETLCWATGRAQATDQAQPNPPPRPYIAALKGNFSMVKKFTYKPKPAAKPTDTQTEVDPVASGPDLAELDTIGSDTLRKDKQIFVDGTSTEIWRSGGLRFIINSINPQGVAVASHQMSFYVDPADFKEVEWVGLAVYKGEQMLDDKKCYYYAQGDKKAWVDESTSLPLLVDSSLVHITYTYGTSDTELRLPANCEQKLKEMRRAWAGMPK